MDHELRKTVTSGSQEGLRNFEVRTDRSLRARFRFADMSHRGSLLCLPNAIWARSVRSQDRSTALRWRGCSACQCEIDTLLIGTGSEVWIAPAPLRNALRQMHVTLDTMQTGPAIRTYNVMMGERRRVAAALIAVP